MYSSRVHFKMGSKQGSAPGGNLRSFRIAVLGGLLIFGAGHPAMAEAPSGAPGERSERREELVRQAEDLMSMPATQAREKIKSMNLSQAMSIYDLMVQEAQKKGVGPQVFYAAEQIQLLKATADSQKRLESLIWVIVLTLVLFAGYLTYVLLDQRRLYRRMQELRSSPRTGADRTASEVSEIYRGE